MLTSKMKQVLDVLISAHYQDETDPTVYASDKFFKGLTPIEVDSALELLAEDGYIQLRPYSDGGNSVSVTVKGLDYKEIEEKLTPSSSTNIFNAPVSNSAIGNSGSVTVNNGISFQDAISFVQSQDISQTDRTEATKVIEYLQTLSEADAPIKKGALSKFGDVLNKFHWLSELVMKLLFAYFTGIQV